MQEGMVEWGKRGGETEQGGRHNGEGRLQEVVNPAVMTPHPVSFPPNCACRIMLFKSSYPSSTVFSFSSHVMI